MGTFTLEQSQREWFTSHSGLPLVGACIRQSELKRHLGPLNIGLSRISMRDILVSFVGLLCLGKSDYQAISTMRGDEFFMHSLDISRVPSPELLRQRLDKCPVEVRDAVWQAILTMLRNLNVAISGYGREFDDMIPVDIDVTPQDNSNTKKEGVSRTYHNYDGYAPIAAYIGLEGWCLLLELRPGSQHAQNGFVEFFGKALRGARRVVGDKPLLVRLDSAHDAFETIWTLKKAENVHFIVKWNPRRANRHDLLAQAQSQGREEPAHRNGKRSWLLEMKDERQDGQGRTVACRRLVRVSEERITASGQMLVAPEIEVEGWLTDLPYEAARIFRLYKDHATSEQYHSELKTDLDLERLPSGKFATNALVMSLGAFAFNILRAIGQIGLLGQYGKLRHPAMRRRLRTVMQELLYVAARVVRHGHEWILRFGRHCPAYAAIQGALVQLGRAAPVFAG